MATLCVLSPLGGVRLATMHEAKGLEFRAVVVMPDPKRLEGIGDIGELETAFELNVICLRCMYRCAGSAACHRDRARATRKPYAPTRTGW